jgi:hypothetical protein
MRRRDLAITTTTAGAAWVLFATGCVHSLPPPASEGDGPASAVVARSKPVPLGPWDCAYPAGVRENQWTTWIQVTVGPSGIAEEATILNVDPQPVALDFGGVAMDCALGHRYLPAQAAAGDAVRATYVQRFDFARSPSLAELARAFQNARRSPPMLLRNVLDP